MKCIIKIVYLFALLLPISVSAQKVEPYAVLSDNNTVLTFYYDNQKEARGGMSVGPFLSEGEREWNGNSSKITTVVFEPSFAKCITLTSTAYWFYWCYNLTSIAGLENVKTGKVTNMLGMFSGCSSLTSLDVSGFKTDNVTSMDGMFRSCSSLTSLDVSGFKTDNVTSMNSMFYSCSSLTSLDVSGFKTDNVTSMNSMFLGCSSLTSLDVSGFKTDNVTDMGGMFYDCSSLTSLDVSSFKTDKVTNMFSMFRSCSSLTSLDLGSFKTNNVKDMGWMFAGCHNLSTIYVSDGWSISEEIGWKKELHYCMFSGCYKLVGGKGTVFDNRIIDKTYAHIDGGTTNPGYFTNINTILAPTITRNGTTNDIVMTCATAGASIYYTTNGTTPTENNTQYTGPITVSKNCTIKAIAVKEGFENSRVATYNVNWFKVATPTFSYNNLQLTISTTTEGATIYYTTDDSTPSATNGKAQVYSSPISLSANTTVKAIAVKENFNNSDVATFSFKIDDVTCQAPQLLRDGSSNRVLMTSGTTGASIYYTTDGTTPTKESSRYTAPIVVDHNQTIRAIATKDGMFNSKESSFEVDWFCILTIITIGNGSVYYNGTTICNNSSSFTVTKGDNITISISPDTDYRIKSVKLNGTDVTSDVVDKKYTINNIKDSFTLEIEFDIKSPVIKFTDNNVKTICVANWDTDGDEEMSESEAAAVKDLGTVFKGNVNIVTFDELQYFTGLTEIASYAFSQCAKLTSVTIPSGVTKIGRFAFARCISLTSIEIPNSMTNIGDAAFSYCTSLTSVTIGNSVKSISEGAFEECRSLTSVHISNLESWSTIDFESADANPLYYAHHLFLNGVEIKDLVIPNTVGSIGKRAFFNCIGLTSITIPNSVFSIGESAFEGCASLTSVSIGNNVTSIGRDVLAKCKELAAIVWNPEVAFNENVSNPNLLLYVKDKKYAGNVTNVIVNGEADEIILTDAASGNNFYCPQAFTAKSITYEHNYGMKSGLNVCQGWETIALPFDVTSITNKEGKELIPHAAWSVGNNQCPYWLYSLSIDGWKAESSIKANTPYLISMPNNEYYDEVYNITGKVIFKGSNMQVKASDNLNVGMKGNKKLVPNYQNQQADATIYALNVNNQWCQNTASEVEGSVFIQSLRPVRPFEAYLTVSGSEVARRVIPIFEEGESTGIIDLPLRDDINVDTWFTLDGRKLFTKPTEKGVYLNGGKKVLVK